jgi:hypothetical protein
MEGGIEKDSVGVQLCRPCSVVYHKLHTLTRCKVDCVDATTKARQCGHHVGLVFAVALGTSYFELLRTYYNTDTELSRRTSICLPVSHMSPIALKCNLKTVEDVISAKCCSQDQRNERNEWHTSRCSEILIFVLSLTVTKTSSAVEFHHCNIQKGKYNHGVQQLTSSQRIALRSTRRFAGHTAQLSSVSKKQNQPRREPFR